MASRWDGELRRKIELDVAHVLLGTKHRTDWAHGSKSARTTQTTIGLALTLNSAIRRRSGLGERWQDELTWQMFNDVLRSPTGDDENVVRLAACDLLGWTEETRRLTGKKARRARALKRIGSKYGPDSVKLARRGESEREFIESDLLKLTVRYLVDRLDDVANEPELRRRFEATSRVSNASPPTEAPESTDAAEVAGARPILLADLVGAARIDYDTSPELFEDLEALVRDDEVAVHVVAAGLRSPGSPSFEDTLRALQDLLDKGVSTADQTSDARPVEAAVSWLVSLLPEDERLLLLAFAYLPDGFVCSLELLTGEEGLRQPLTALRS